MAVATANQTLWGFLWWIKHNPFVAIETMTTLQLDAMVLAYTTENATDATLSTTDPGAGGAYGATQTFPKTDTAAGSGIAATQTVAACEQSHYPEQHRSGG